MQRPRSLHGQEHMLSYVQHTRTHPMGRPGAYEKLGKSVDGCGHARVYWLSTRRDAMRTEFQRHALLEGYLTAK